MESDYTNKDDCAHLTLCVCASCTETKNVKYDGEWVKVDELPSMTQAFYSNCALQNRRYKSGERELPLIQISDGICKDCKIAKLRDDFKDNPSVLEEIISQLK